MSNSYRTIVPIKNCISHRDPRQFGAHRVAAIALYKALIRACSTELLDESERNALRNTIRNRFRGNVYEQSRKRLQLAFQGGYEALDKLDSVDAGNVDNLNYIRSKLECAPSKLLNATPKLEKVQPKHPPPAACLPEHLKELKIRPRPTVSGVRRVPILTQTSGVPFLRLSHKQPENLSRMIKHLINKSFRRRSVCSYIEDYILPMSIQEDNWDVLVHKNCGIQDVANIPSWEKFWRDALDDIEVESGHFGRKRYQIINRMQRIVAEETKLAEKEKIQRRALGVTDEL